MRIQSEHRERKNLNKNNNNKFYAINIRVIKKKTI